jgi:hypothetical protein
MQERVERDALFIGGLIRRGAVLAHMRLEG